MKRRLEGKIALITGASQGIGEAIALLFAKEGAHVVISDVQDDKGNALAKKCGKDSLYLHLDVQEEKDWQKALHEIQKRYGRLDILYQTQ